MRDQSENKTEDLPALTFIQVMKSTLAAFLGIQNNDNRHRDFERGKPIHYVMVGLLFTFIFVIAVYALVQVVLHFAGV
jgi:hypothetical protein